MQLVLNLLVLVALALGFYFVASFVARRLARGILKRWAHRHGMRVEQARVIDEDVGPRYGLLRQAHVTYRVTVVDAQGHRRSASVRCGGRDGGVWGDDVAVTWEDPQL